MQKDIEKQNNKKVKISILKEIFLFALLISAYFISFYLYGLKKTNTNLIILVICCVGGIFLFLIIYYLAMFITKILDKNSKNKKIVVNCEEEFLGEYSNKEYAFTYNTKITFKDNFIVFKDTLAFLLKDFSIKSGRNQKYYFANFTIYDALDIFGRTVEVVENKVDGIFAFLHIQNKPLGFVEKYLTKVLNGQEEIEEEPKRELNFFDKFKQKTVSVVKNATIGLLKGKINNVANEIYGFVILEASKLYGDDYKKIKQKKLNKIKNSNIEEVKDV